MCVSLYLQVKAQMETMLVVSRSKYEEDRKIEEGIALLVSRELDGKIFFNVGLAMNLVIILLSVLKDKKGKEGILSLEDLEIICMKMKMMNLRKELRVKLMMS